jgi:hypothetical protein
MFYNIQKTELLPNTLLDTDIGLMVVGDKIGEGNFSIAYEDLDDPNVVIIVASKDPERGYDNDFAKEILADYLFEFGVAQPFFPNIRYAGEIDQNNQVFQSRRYYFDQQYFSIYDILIRDILRNISNSIQLNVFNRRKHTEEYFPKSILKVIKKQPSGVFRGDQQMTPKLNKMLRALFIERSREFLDKLSKLLEKGKGAFSIPNIRVSFQNWGKSQPMVQFMFEERAYDDSQKDRNDRNMIDVPVSDDLLGFMVADHYQRMLNRIEHFDDFVNTQHPNMIIDYDFNLGNVAKLSREIDDTLIFVDLIHAHPYEKDVAIFDTKGVYEFPNR